MIKFNEASPEEQAARVQSARDLDNARRVANGIAPQEPKHEYLFDVTLIAAFRFRAASEQEARRLLAEALNCASINAGAINGVELVGEGSMEGEADLAEVDGECV